MGIVTRQSIKSLIVTATGVVIGTLNTLWLYPRFFTPDQYGLTQVLLALSIVLTQFSQLGLTTTFINFFPYVKEDKNKTGAFIALMFIAPIAGFTVVSVATLFFQETIQGLYIEKSKLLVDYYYWIYPMAFFYIYLYMLYSYCRSNLRIVFPALVSDLMIKALIGLEILMVHLGFISFPVFILLFAANFALASMALWIYAVYFFGFPVNFRFQLFTSSFYRQIFYYSLFVILGAAGATVVQKIDILMVSSMLGLSFTAVYSIAFFMGVAIELPLRPVVMLAMPLISEAWKKNDMKTIGDIYKKSSLNLFIIGCLIFLAVWGNIDEIFRLIPNAEFYAQGKYVVLFILLAKLFDMLTGVNGEIIRTSRYYYVDFITMFFLVAVSVLTNYLLIPVWGITGAAAATAFSVFCFNTVRFIFLAVRFNIQPFTAQHILTFLLAAVVLSLSFFIPEFPHSFTGALLSIFLKTMLMIPLFLFFIYRLKLSEDIVAVMRQPLKAMGVNFTL